ncbi:MAG TPA: 4-hydroxybutyrate--acetyl-CoA CoA transferase, partial [Novosphingobium sp.]|nr:4-hydroxybutyrate--acetyl-CoA CoA transferase [Novosphingobium sp.]
MTAADLYRSKLLTPDAAAALIESDSDLAMGMAAAEPPALLAALARRVEAGELENLRLWYFHSMEHAATSVLRPDLLGRVRPHCMFMSRIERELLKTNPQAIEFVPVAFSESPRLLARR